MTSSGGIRDGGEAACGVLIGPACRTWRQSRPSADGELCRVGAKPAFSRCSTGPGGVLVTRGGGSCVMAVSDAPTPEHGVPPAGLSASRRFRWPQRAGRAGRAAAIAAEQCDARQAADVSAFGHRTDASECRAGRRHRLARRCNRTPASCQPAAESATFQRPAAISEPPVMSPGHGGRTGGEEPPAVSPRHPDTDASRVSSWRRKRPLGCTTALRL